jgi:subtilisin-like proprotein convertase family protein
MVNSGVGTPHLTVPAGDYKPDVPFTALQGADLNGMWTFRVTDMYGVDNGFLFKWSINFDPSLVVDCSGPIIE